MLRKIYFFATIVAALLFISSCQEEETPNYPVFPIQGKSSFFLEGPEITWTALKSSEFSSYRVWRSAGIDTVPNDPIGKAFLLTTITDPEVTKFTDFSFNNSSATSAYYRIEGVLKNRSVWSKNFKLNNSSIDFKNAIDAVVFDKNSDLIFLADKLSNIIYKFDSKKEEIVGKLTFQNGTSGTVLLSLGKNGTKTELYLAQENKLRIFDAETFKQTEIITLDKNILAISNDNEGRVFISTSDQLKIIDRNNSNTESTYPAATLSTTVYRHYYIPNDNSLLRIESGSPFLASIFKLNANHTEVISTEVEQKLKGITSSTDFSKVVILDANKFVISNKGYIVDRTLTNIAKLSSSFNTSTLSAFKDIQITDNQSIIGSTSNSSSSSFGNSIVTWQYPNIILDEKNISFNNTILFLMPMKDKTWALVNNTNNLKINLVKLKN